MQDEPPAAGKPSGYTSLFTDANWWPFCLLIFSLKFSLLAFDPLPKLYMGDSGSYIWTALSGWIPPDRSFIYGYVIRWSSVWTESLNSLMVLQVSVGAGTALVFASTCRLIFRLSPRLSYVFGILCSVDPLQLLWEHYVMTETISLFLYVVMLRYSFLYLRDRRVRDLVLVQVLAIVLLSFRLSYLILVQISTVILPIMAYLPLAYARFRGDSKVVPRASIIKQFSCHLLLSVLLMLLLHRGYKEINGALSHREPDYGYNSGLHLLAVWAPALKPEDAVDPRLAQVIAQGSEYHIEELAVRNNQRFTPGFLVDRWLKLEGDAQKANEIGKQTAMRALQRNPLNILTLGLKTYLAFWDIRSWRIWANLDLGHALDEQQMSVLANRFHYPADPLSREQRPTILQAYFLKSYPYCLLVMAAPALSGVSLLLRRTRTYCALVFLHASITLAVVTIFTPNPSVRYVQPVSLLTLLIFAVYAKALSDRWSIDAALISGDLRKKGGRMKEATATLPPIRSCVICQSARLHYLFSVSGYRVVRCDDCGLLLTNPQPSDDELGRLYSEGYFLTGRDEAEQHCIDQLKQQTGSLYLDLIERYRGPGGNKLLEIGSGHGDLLVRAASSGWAVTGVEYSAHACKVAERKLTGRSDSQVICGEVTDVPGEGLYDVCVLSDIIEHVRNPRLFLEQVHHLLKPGGVILIATPSLDSWSARLLKKRWMELKSEHLFYFKSSTLQTLLIDCGFGEIIERPGVKVLDLNYIAGHFERYKVRGISAFTRAIHRILPKGLNRKPFRVVASGMVQLARKREMPHRPRLSIIVPVFNEILSFRTAFERLITKKVEGLEIELIVVESHSTDGTREQVLRYRDHPRVKILLEDVPRGKGHAVRAGLKQITGDFVMIQDADLEYDVEDYEALLEPLLRKQAAFVLGARHGGSTWKMRQFEEQPVIAAILNLAHWFFTVLINLFFDARLHDPFTMYKVFRRDCLYGIKFECDRFDFDWELVIKFLRKGYRPLEIPVNYRSRSFSEGKKVSFFRDPLTWLRVLVKLRFQRFDPLREIERARYERGPAETSTLTETKEISSP